MSQQEMMRKFAKQKNEESKLLSSIDELRGELGAIASRLDELQTAVATSSGAEKSSGEMVASKLDALQAAVATSSGAEKLSGEMVVSKLGELEAVIASMLRKVEQSRAEQDTEIPPRELRAALEFVGARLKDLNSTLKKLDVSEAVKVSKRLVTVAGTIDKRLNEIDLATESVVRYGKNLDAGLSQIQELHRNIHNIRVKIEVEFRNVQESLDYRAEKDREKHRAALLKASAISSMGSALVTILVLYVILVVFLNHYGLEVGLLKVAPKP